MDSPHRSRHGGSVLTVRKLALGEPGDVTTVPQTKNAAGRWVTAPRPQKALRWKARAYVRGFDGGRSEIARFARTRRGAEEALDHAVREFFRAGDAPLTPTMSLVAAGEFWLDQIDRPGSGMSRRTVTDYAALWRLYVDGADSAVRRLTLAQANDPQRLRMFLQGIADTRGTVSAQKTKALLSNVLEYAVNNDVLPDNAARRVRAVKSKVPKPKARDHTRAMTRAERDHVIEVAYAAAAETDLNPRAQRKRRTTADLVGFLGGTGVRIEEARQLRWSDMHLDRARVYVRGTKSQMADRWLNLPPWLVVKLSERAARSGTDGLVFASPAYLNEPEIPWNQSNSAGAVRDALDAAGMTWAIPHTFRRTVASLLDQAGAPIASIADQLGHADVSMTARVYLGRDLKGDKGGLAAVL
jgi:integrase